MEWHIKCDPKEINRYVFCPGDQQRARKIATMFDEHHLVTESRGYVVLSGTYQGIPMTACGTGMGGPAVAIGIEELAHMGADTFIRVGSCGVFQEGQKSGSVCIATGTVRMGGTANAYLPPIFPAVPTFSVLRALVEAGEELKIPTWVGIGSAGDAFYAPRRPEDRAAMRDAGLVFAEMESDTLFIVGQVRHWRTGAIFTSDGTPEETKPDAGEEAYQQGQIDTIRIALRAMEKIASTDKK